MKNLERVQGDERDAIVLSVGYAKSADGRLSHNFGPINYEGGERRLNVAVTRARKRMTVVSSFSHFDVDPSRTSSHGAELLRSYLEYAASGGNVVASTPGASSGTSAALNPFEEHMLAAMRKADLPVRPQFGVSGYRIDFALAHPEQPAAWCWQWKPTAMPIILLLPHVIETDFGRIILKGWGGASTASGRPTGSAIPRSS